MYVRMHACMSVSIYACMHICLCVCFFVWRPIKFESSLSAVYIYIIYLYCLDQ